ncbi:MAG: tetratricopeptide repeat protein [Deltaproteobacteria bacterium]|nr:tetratricopeptide repeat protein [Deltaproteobacteria bacterium]
MKKIITGFVLVLLVVGCAGTAGKKASSSKAAKVPKGQNSYYYFLLSEIKNAPETFAESEMFLDQALKKDPRSGYLWAGRAVNEAKKSNWKNAVAYAAKSLEMDPENVDSLVLMGKLHAAQREPQKAVTYYQRALAIDKGVEEIYNVMAREYLSLNDEGSAIKILGQCLDELPETLSCLYYLATIHQQNENYNEALKYFSVLQELNPENPKLLQTIAEIYLKKKDYKRALEVFNQIQQMLPSDMGVLVRMGLIYYEIKDVDRAIEVFLKIVAKFPQSDRVNYFLGLLYREKNEFDNAIKYLDKINPDSTFYQDAVKHMMAVLRLTGDNKAAVALLEKKFTEKDDSEQIVSLKAFLLMKDADYKKALLVLDTGLKKFKGSQDLLFQRAVVLDKMGDWKTTKRELQGLLAVKPKLDRVLNFLGYSMLVRDEDLKQATEYISRAYALNPSDGHIVDSLGWAYYKTGDYQKALEYLLKAAKLKTDEPTIFEHVGDVYFKLKNKKSARWYYEQALGLLEKTTEKSAEQLKQVSDIKNKLGQF